MVQDSVSRRLRRRLAARAERVLDRFGLVEPRRAPPGPPQPTRAEVPAAPAPAPLPAPAPVASAPEAVEASGATAPAESAAAGAAGEGMTFEAVQELFDDMVRPALQSDGGDITLREVVDGEVRVTLVGACSTCPSSIVTMKMGIERLLEEEFADFRALVQV